MEAECCLEMMYELWVDGDCYEIGPDRDGLDLVEIRLRSDGKITHRMTFSKAAALNVAKALNAVAVASGQA
jgi:hypothetical protein